MRSTILGAGLVGLGLLFAGTTLSAHHAFSSEFDANRHVVFTGTVTKMMWVNPHAWIYVDVKKADGTTEEWMVEAGTPNTLLRRGFTKASLQAGTMIKVDGYQSKDGSLRANGRDLTLPDGRTLFLGNADGAGGAEGTPK
ncbi:MAG TPA: DUF6152 family protein [Vicinamibacterales bacterium]|nr:DUF6152 family protein [Vicinamibacterales bacterium]